MKLFQCAVRRQSERDGRLDSRGLFLAVCLDGNASAVAIRTPKKMAYIEAILREPQIFQSFQKRFQYLESSGAILARSTRHRFGKSRIPKKLSQNRSKSAQNCSKLLTSAQNCSKSLTSAQNCMKFAFKSHISIIISTQYSNILAILREIGANIQYQYLDTAKTILFGCLSRNPPPRGCNKSLGGSDPPRSMASFQAGDTAPGRVRGARK